MCTISPPVGLTARGDATPRDTRRTALLRAARARIDDVGGGARETEVRSFWTTGTCSCPDVDVGAACALERRLVARVKGRVEFADVPVGKELELATVSPETSCVMFQHMGEG